MEVPSEKDIKLNSRIASIGVMEGPNKKGDLRYQVTSSPELPEESNELMPVVVEDNLTFCL